MYQNINLSLAKEVSDLMRRRIKRQGLNLDIGVATLCLVIVSAMRQGEPDDAMVLAKCFAMMANLYFGGWRYKRRDDDD